MFVETITEYNLVADIALIRSAMNKADVGLHVLWFGGLLHGRTHAALFANYHQSFSNEVQQRRY